MDEFWSMREGEGDDNYDIEIENGALRFDGEICVTLFVRDGTATISSEWKRDFSYVVGLDENQLRTEMRGFYASVRDAALSRLEDRDSETPAEAES
jgi:hypothetical protein